MVEIMAAHRVPYIATASPGHLNDLAAKVEKAKSIRGTKVIIVLIPCLPGWGVADNAAIKTARLAVDCGVFPLYEVENGEHYRLTQQTRTQPVEAYLAQQKRYRHLTGEEVESMQADVDREWERLQHKASISP
jgi:pyruvate ferredoxin oxidoreductase beta subunit/2-oxoisovalerate ferredoxin oxidoreductase beta subunit